MGSGEYPAKWLTLGSTTTSKKTNAGNGWEVAQVMIFEKLSQLLWTLGICSFWWHSPSRLEVFFLCEGDTILGLGLSLTRSVFARGWNPEFSSTFWFLTTPDRLHISTKEDEVGAILSTLQMVSYQYWLLPVWAVDGVTIGWLQEDFELGMKSLVQLVSTSCILLYGCQTSRSILQTVINSTKGTFFRGPRFPGHLFDPSGAVATPFQRIMKNSWKFGFPKDVWCGVEDWAAGYRSGICACEGSAQTGFPIFWLVFVQRMILRGKLVWLCKWRQ